MLVAALETAGYGELEPHKNCQYDGPGITVRRGKKCHNPEPGTQVNKNREQLK
ncbi:hypothetical protein NKJ72_04380 [Mesorhizobium sp. M0045]|uniref:hypothetical protein n=1 Tax=unclassified Mesorhizobium TaxID=325217 RepID=UPI00333B254E